MVWLCSACGFLRHVAAWLWCVCAEVCCPHDLRTHLPVRLAADVMNAAQPVAQRHQIGVQRQPPQHHRPHQRALAAGDAPHPAVVPHDGTPSPIDPGGPHAEDDVVDVAHLAPLRRLQRVRVVHLGETLESVRAEHLWGGVRVVAGRGLT